MPYLLSCYLPMNNRQLCLNMATIIFLWRVLILSNGGGGGIRTHGGEPPTPVFKTGALDHSATPPIDRNSQKFKPADLAFL